MQIVQAPTAPTRQLIPADGPRLSLTAYVRLGQDNVAVTVWMPDRARYGGREYRAVSWVPGRRGPEWLLRDENGFSITVSDDREPGTEVRGECPACGDWTLAVAEDGPSMKGYEWVCLADECIGPQPPRFPVGRLQSREW